MTIKKIFIFIFLCLAITGCADPATLEGCVSGTPRGFWHGLFHGFVSPISFVASLFTDSIAMYDVNNNGGWYNFGFILGAGILTKSAKKPKR
jgi:hypothetical protein